MMPEFTPFRLDIVNQCLWRRTDEGEDERILLTPKAFAVLNHLVEHAGQLVTHRQLLDAVWPRTAIEPQALKRNIFELRRALDDPPRKPRFIETLPRRGYRFIAKVGHGSVETSDAVTARPPGHLVGRDHALAELRQSLRNANTGKRQIVFVTGEPGIGKTALVEELQRLAAELDPSVCIAGGQCLEGFGSREAFYPVLEAVGQLYRGHDGARVVETLATHAPTWLVQFPALLKTEHRETLQQEILGATRDRMLREICEALESIPLGSTLLLVLEDLHWVDYSTIDFISALARRRSPANIMLVATYRPTDVSASNHPLNALKSDLVARQLCYEIALQPLGESDIVQYLTAERAGPGLPEGLAALVHRHSEGNPLFMIAVLNHFREQRLIEQENGAWRLQLPLARIDLAVPESLRQMIEAQIDRLGVDEQRTLEVASVAGQSFNPQVSAAAADLDAEFVDKQCEALARRGLFVRFAGTQDLPDGTIAQRYEFLHALYREVLYGRQAPARRAMLHRQFGERLEAIFATRSGDVASELAHHFEHGADWQRAVTYLRLAATVCARRYAPNEATATLQHALDLAAKLPETSRGRAETEILETLAGMYLITFDRRTVDVYKTLQARAAQYGLTGTEVRALVRVAYPLSWSSAHEALDVIERALHLSADERDPLTRARTRAACLVRRIWISGWNADDANKCRKALAEVRRSGDNMVVALHVIECAFIDFCSSAYRTARQEVLEARATLMERHDDYFYPSYGTWMSEFHMPWSLLLLGEWGEVLNELEAGIALARRNGDPYREQTLNLYRAWLHLHAMDFNGVRDICASILPAFADPTSTPWRRLCRVLAAGAETGLGKHESALDDLLAVQRDMAQRAVIHDWYCRLVLQSVLTDLLLAKGDLARAREAGEAFLAITGATAERTWQALAWEANARIALASLDLHRAQACIGEGLSTMSGFDVPLAAWRVHATAAELSERLGDTETAKHHRELGRRTVLQLANSLELEDPLRARFLSTPSVAAILA
jgi:DNA-binding winged helix-turn-helix (wHTH) protein